MEAVNKNDLETLKQLVSKDVVYTVYRKGGPVTFSGVDGLGQVMGLAGGAINVKPTVVLADKDYVFVLAKLTGKRKGRTLNTENCYLYRFRNGKLVEGKNIPTDQLAFDEFWS